MSSRKAIVIIHGMGSQRPLKTNKEFAENIDTGGTRLYSSPDRITEDLEARRYSYHNRSNDYFELYWADLVEEPDFFDTVLWTIRLLYFKKPSERAHVPINILRILIVILFGGFICLALWLNSWMHGILDNYSVIASGIIIFIVFKLLIPLFKIITKNSISRSVGDVLRYTQPSYKNIRFRNKIRKKGIDLLEKLHEEKNEDGKFTYSDIVVVGHSLGSVVAYDILTALFPKYQHTYVKGKSKINFEKLNELVEYADRVSDFDIERYQELQREAVYEFRKIQYGWRVSDFITIGSPLTHASMIISENKEELDEKQSLREFPKSPPVEDEDDKLKFFYQNNKNDNEIVIPHHAAFFALTRWTNIYFRNDFIGGKLSHLFGKGIRDVCLTPEASFWRRWAPFVSHTKYWDKEEKLSKELLNKTI